MSSTLILKDASYDQQSQFDLLLAEAWMDESSAR